MLYGSNALPTTIDNHLVDVPINRRAKQVVLPDAWSAQRRSHPNFLCSAMVAMVSWTCLQELMVWPRFLFQDLWHVGPHASSSKNYWPLETIQSVFGQENIRLVDLTNDGEVNSIVAELISAGVHDKLPYSILYSRDLFKGKKSWCPNYWAEVLQCCEKGWLIGQFAAATADPQAQHGNGADPGFEPVDISLSGDQFDRKNPWIERTLARMPQPRPVFLLARDDTGAFLESRSRGKRRAQDPHPQYRFDDNSKLFKKARHK